MRWSFPFLAIVLIAATPAAAAPERKASNPSKRICRVQDEIGTRFKRRVCATAREWQMMDEIAAEARRNIDKIQTRACDGTKSCAQ